jgi:hypothetical protein
MPETPEAETASSLVGSQGRRVAGLIVAVVAPVTLITALAYYFGYRRESAFAGYFGIDPSTLGFTTNDYVLGVSTPSSSPSQSCCSSSLPPCSCTRSPETASSASTWHR